MINARTLSMKQTNVFLEMKVPGILRRKLPSSGGSRGGARGGGRRLPPPRAPPLDPPLDGNFLRKMPGTFISRNTFVCFMLRVLAFIMT